MADGVCSDGLEVAPRLQQSCETTCRPGEQAVPELPWLSVASILQKIARRNSSSCAPYLAAPLDWKTKLQLLNWLRSFGAAGTNVLLE
jgi:hypothetical protein